MMHVHQGSTSSMQIIEMTLRDAIQPYFIVVTPCWVVSTAKRCFPQFSATSARQQALFSSVDSKWVVRLSPSAATVSLHSFAFTSRCSSIQFQSSFALVPLMLQTTPLAASTQAYLLSRHISNVINVFNNVSSSSFLTISCVAFADVGSACGATVRRIHFRVELFISALNYSFPR